MSEDLLEVNIFSSEIVNIPDLTNAANLRRLDARSCKLSTIPRPMFAGPALNSTSFLLTIVGNSFVDVAADILLPLPDEATINFDSYVRYL